MPTACHCRNKSRKSPLKSLPATINTETHHCSDQRSPAYDGITPVSDEQVTSVNKNSVCPDDHNSEITEENELIENLSEILNSTLTQSYHNELDNEATIDYSNSSQNKSNVSQLVEYYEGQNDEEDMKESKEDIKSVSPIKVIGKKLSEFTDEDNCEMTDQRRLSMQEYSDVTVDYDWKDVSQVPATEETDESMVVVSSSIYALSNADLRQRLMKVGEIPGPISDTTRTVYQRYLAKVERNNDRPLKVSVIRFIFRLFNFFM